MIKKIIILIVLICSLGGCGSKELSINTNAFKNNDSNTYYGYLNIPVIDMNLGFYNYDSPLNDVSKNIELIDTGIKNTYLIAAHSGSGYLAYFNDLRKLHVGDEVYLKFKDKTNHYEVTGIRREVKDGSIRISDEENQLILTTCDQVVKGYQLIIEAKIIGN